MFGGLLKSTSLAALVAVAGVTLSGAMAQAADLKGAGGNCCADLEERIAELEATTARKGNRKVSLEVSGQVNEQVMFWDDGVESNAYVTTNEQSRSRFRFVGKAKIDANWTAGYLLEIGVRGNRGDQVGQNRDTGDKGLDVRHSAWWLQNKDLGKIWVGQTSQAADGITEISLASTGHFATAQIQDYINGFSVRGANGAQGNLTYSNLWNGLSNPGEGLRYNVVKYETPTLAGFIGSASWGEDDVWDVALRYSGEFNGIKLAGGIAYASWTDGNTNGATPAGFGERGCARVINAAGTGSDVKCDELGLSGSIMHVPTGLFLTGAYGYRNDDNRQKVAFLAGTQKKDEFYLIQGGIEQAFMPVGKSTFFGEYYEGNFGAPVNNATGTAVARTLTGVGFTANSIASTDVQMWGVGFNQNIAAAAMDIYVNYRNYNVDVKDVAGNKAALNDLQTVIMGARIQF
jgi:hypothetical protein